MYNVRDHNLRQELLAQTSGRFTMLVEKDLEVAHYVRKSCE